MNLPFVASLATTAALQIALFWLAFLVPVFLLIIWMRNRNRIPAVTPKWQAFQNEKKEWVVRWSQPDDEGHYVQMLGLGQFDAVTAERFARELNEKGELPFKWGSYRPAGNRVVCSWCDLTLREGVDPASHSICPECRKNLLNEEIA